MAYFALDCVTNVGNTGLQECVEKFGVWKKFLLADADFEIATQALAETEATWTTAINAASQRLYPLFEHFNGEPDQEERVDAEGWDGEREVVREGSDSFRAMFRNLSMYNHVELRKHNNRTNLAVYIVTSKGYILGKSDDRVKFLPFKVSDFYVEKRNISDGTDYDRTSLRITINDVTQTNDKIVWVKPTDFDPLLFDGIKDCNLSGTLGATGATITVTGASDGQPIVGLVSANFNLYDDTDPSTPIAVTATDNGDGTYTCTWGSISGAHTLELFDQPIGTSGYESAPYDSGKVSTTV